MFPSELEAKITALVKKIDALRAANASAEDIAAVDAEIRSLKAGMPKRVVTGSGGRLVSD